MAFKIFEREYQLRTNLFKVRIDYWADESSPFGEDKNLDFDVINTADFVQGYDDEDNLVFYPNKIKLIFDDLSKRNFNILKESLSQPEADLIPINKVIYGGVRIWVNGENIFYGYIDSQTFHYVESERELEFEAIDRTTGLKDIAVTRMTEEGYWANIGEIVHKCYAQVMPELSSVVYGHSNFTNGLYIKHDWIFTGHHLASGSDIVRNWNNADSYDFLNTRFNFDSTGIYGENRYAKTLSDLLRIIALQFGMIIGNATPTKIYMVKRFAGINFTPEVIDDKIQLDFERAIHLKPLAGVRNKNTWNGERWYSSGIVETIDGNITGELKYPQSVKDIQTYIGSYLGAAGSGTAIRTAPEYPVFEGVQDLNISINKRLIPQILCDWEYKNRKFGRERFSATLDGTDYSLDKIYRIHSLGIMNRRINYRPIKIAKDYVKNDTKMIGVEFD